MGELNKDIVVTQRSGPYTQPGGGGKQGWHVERIAGTGAAEATVLLTAGQIGARGCCWFTLPGSNFSNKGVPFDLGVLKLIFPFFFFF